MSDFDDPDIVSGSPEGLARIMAVIVVACQEFGLMISQKSPCVQEANRLLTELVSAC